MGPRRSAINAITLSRLNGSPAWWPPTVLSWQQYLSTPMFHEIPMKLEVSPLRRSHSPTPSLCFIVRPLVTVHFKSIDYRLTGTLKVKPYASSGARRALTPLALSPLVRVLVRMLERREGLRRAHMCCLVRVQLEREP